MDVGSHDDGWQQVRPANEIREEEQIAKWEASAGHWSGIGKHPIDFPDHKKIHLSQDRELGTGAFGVVERITYGTVTMARKHVKSRRNIPFEKLREEANNMEKLAHRHILKLVGTYTHRRNSLYLLLYPVAICDLSKFLEDLDEIQSESFADQEDAYKRLRLLGLQDVNSSAIIRGPASAPGRATTALGFLQQIMGCITEALAYAHEEGIRHCDLKPKNILLSPGRVYITDFGISRYVRESENSITSGRYGTPSWHAPEVADESEHHLSPSDIYSLGCIFLNIATILHGDTLEAYEHVMKEPNWPKKYEKLEKHLKDLRVRVAQEELENEEEPTFNVKHILGLVGDMLKRIPEGRPKAGEVSAKLCEFGGLDQVYHLPCCHKKSSQVSELINTKLRTLHELNVASALKISQLEAANTQKQERINYLESVHGNWEKRIENEREHAGKQYQALMKNYNHEVNSRKALEERVKALEAETQNHGRGPFPFHNKRKNKANFAANGKAINGTGGTKSNPPPLFGQNGNGTVFMPGTTQLQRRTSNIPMPVRPSTPIRTPSRPYYERDPDSNTSTLRSSIHSTFSRTSIKTNDSASSVDDATVRSTSPPSSPTTHRPQDTSQILADLKIPSSPKLVTTKSSTISKANNPAEARVAVTGAKFSYARAVAGHGAG